MEAVYADHIPAYPVATMRRKWKFLKALPNFRVTLELIRFDLTRREIGWYSKSPSKHGNTLENH